MDQFSRASHEWAFAEQQRGQQQHTHRNSKPRERVGLEEVGCWDWLNAFLIEDFDMGNAGEAAGCPQHATGDQSSRRRCGFKQDYN